MIRGAEELDGAVHPFSDSRGTSTKLQDMGHMGGDTTTTAI